MAEPPCRVPPVNRFPRAVRIFLVSLLYCLLLPAGPVLAGADPVEIEADRLRELRERISSFRSELESVRGQRDTQQEALAETDKAIGALSADLRRLDSELDQGREKLAGLEDERSRVQDRLKGMHSILERELRAAWLGGRQQHIRLLLNQDDPTRLGRMMTYQAYFTKARAQRMEIFRTTLEQLQQTERALQEQQAANRALREQQQQQSERLSAEQENQRRILAGLQQQLDAGTLELARLEQDEQRVSKLLHSLQQALRDIPPVESSQKPLHRQQGELKWPVAGRISTPFGARQAAGKMKSRGVHIATRAGTDVHAVAKGRVAFADWLRGFGLLIIIDHGEGYMSLYGENSSLYKAVGEWVSQGEVIAAAGNSGGQLRTGVYFELRRNGQPVNPSSWFRGKPEALRAGS